MNTYYHLSHGGPGSGRYPLGSGDRPYQKFEGSRRKSSGISGYIKSIKSRKAEERQQKEKLEAQKKAEKAAEEKRKHEANRERILRGGSASEILKYQGELSNQELRTAVDRLDLEKRLHDISQKETKSSMDKFNNIMKTVKTGNEWAKIGMDSYNTFASIYNATEEGKKKPLTLINKGGR